MRPLQPEYPATGVSQRDMDPQPDPDLETTPANKLKRGKVALSPGGDSGIGRSVAIAAAKVSIIVIPSHSNYFN
jgi:hypothetical protein